MAVTPQGENSKDYQINSIVAAGGNSSAARSARVESQLRDRFGRWVEMGRDCKIKIRFNGKILSIIGRFVGGSPDKPGYGMFVVKGDPNGIPDGVYHFKGKALNSILASLDSDYLKKNNIEVDRDVNGNLIGDVLDKDIEDLNNIKREEIGTLDEALANGEVEPEEDEKKVIARLNAPKHESDNVVATLDKASKDDILTSDDIRALLPDLYDGRGRIKEDKWNEQLKSVKAKLPSQGEEDFPENDGVEQGLNEFEKTEMLKARFGEEELSSRIADIRAIEDEYAKRQAFRKLYQDAYNKAQDGSPYQSAYGDAWENDPAYKELKKIKAFVPENSFDKELSELWKNQDARAAVGTKEWADRVKAVEKAGSQAEADEMVARLKDEVKNLTAPQDSKDGEVEQGLKALAESGPLKVAFGAEKLDTRISEVSQIQDPYQKRVAFRKLYNDVYNQSMDNSFTSAYGDKWEDTAAYKELEKIKALVPKNSSEKEWDALWENQDARAAVGNKEWADKVKDAQTTSGSQAEADKRLATLKKEAEGFAKPQATDVAPTATDSKRRRESWYADGSGKNYSEQNVPDEIKTPENRRTWDPNTNQVVDGNGNVIPFAPTYDDKFNPVPSPEDAPQYETSGNPFWDSKEMDASGTRTVQADELMTADVDAAYENLYKGGYLMCNKETAVAVLLKASKEAEAKKKADKEKGQQPKASQEVLDQIKNQLDSLQPATKMRIMSAVDLKKLSASEADEMLGRLVNRKFRDTSSVLTTEERTSLVSNFRNLPIDMTNMQVIGDKGITQNGLGVARGDMPAVKSADHEAFEQRLKELGVNFSFEEMPASDMIQIQREMSADNVGGMVESILEGSFKPWLTKAGNPNPIYVAQNGEILDGHHRWAAAKAAGWQTGEDPNIPVVKIDLPYEDALTLMNEWGNFHGIESQTLDKNRKGNLAEFFEVTKEQHLASIFDEIESTGFADVDGLKNGGSADEGTRRLRDHILTVSDLIEQHADSPLYTREQLYNNLMQASVEHASNLANGVPYTPKKFIGKADTIGKITARKEGATLDALTLSQPRKGVAVAVEGTNEEMIDSFFYADGIGELMLADYIDQNIGSFSGEFKLGTWHDKDNNEVTLDVIELFPEANRDEAISAGQNRNQQGIFKLSNKEYIETGGTGDRGRARREREQSRGESSLRPSDRQGRVESPQSSRQGGESSIPEATTNSGSPELAAVPARGVRKFDTREDKYDSYELTGDRASDTINMLDLGQADMLSGIRDPKSVENYNTQFDSIRERLISGDRNIQDSAINDLTTVSLKVLNELYHQPGGLTTEAGWLEPDYNTATELSRSFIWYARNISNEAYPREVALGVDAFMPDLDNITTGLPKSKESEEIDSILAELKEAHTRKGPKGYPRDDVLSALGKLKQQLSDMYYESFYNNQSDFNGQEWGNLMPIRDRVANFMDAAVKGWKPEDYVTSTVPQAANKEVFTSKLVDEVIPEIQADVEEGSKVEEMLSKVVETLNAGGETAEALVELLDAYNSSDNDGASNKVIESIQKLVNSTKKFKKAYRPNNSRTPESEIPENPGSDENPNKEPVDPADDVVDGTVTPEESTESMYSRVGIERALALKLDMRSIDRSKLSERQKKILKAMITQRNKAIKTLTANVESGSTEGYDRNYHYALATTNAIKRLVGGAEQYGESYDFGSGEDERVKNFVILEDSIKYGVEDSKGIKKVTYMKGYYTSKSGKTYIAVWNHTQSAIYTIKADGTEGRQAGYVNTGWSGELSRGPEFEPSVTPSYLKTSGTYRGDGIAGANITFARLAIEKSGRHFSHSSALTQDGANNSKGIDRAHPDRHHLGQSEKVLDMMGSPSMELLNRLGWFDESYKMVNGPDAFDYKNFKTFRTPIQGRNPVMGAGNFTGPLYLHDNILISDVTAEARRKKMRGEDVVAGVDYPEFMKEHVESDSGNYGSFSLRTLMTEMSYKDGISKKDGIKRLKDMQKQLADWRANRPEPAEPDGYSARSVNARLDQIDKSISELVNGLETWDEFDEKRIDRPKPFPVDGFKTVSGKPYGDVKSDPMSEVFDYGIGKPFSYKYYARGDNAFDYEQWKGNAPPENWTNDGFQLSIRHTTDELKAAVKDAVLKDGIDPEKDWGVMLDHSRDYAETPEMAEVQLSSALRGLWLQGVDSDEFIASVIDEKNNNDDMSNKLKESRLPRVSLLKEIDNALKNMGVKNVKFTQRMQIAEKVKTGSYDSDNKIVGTNQGAEVNSWSYINDLQRASNSPNERSPLIDNDKFDYSDGREDVLGAPSTIDTWKETDRDRVNNGEMSQYTTTNPYYIAKAFDKDDLVKAFGDALAEERNGINLKFANGELAEVPLASIRDALQFQGVDTNALARKTFTERVGRAEMDAKLKPQGLIVPRTSNEVVQHGSTVIDLNDFVPLTRWLGGINSPELWQDPKTGKKYIVKALDDNGNGDGWADRAVDQEIATQAFFRALGVNASAPQRGTYNGQNNIVVSEYIDASTSLNYFDVIDAYHATNDPDGKYAAAVRNGLMADLFIDQIDGVFNTTNVIIDTDGNIVRIDGGGGLMWDPIPSEGSKADTRRYAAGGFAGRTNPEQIEALNRTLREGSFTGDGIDFSLDYFLNPKGWHWNMGNTARETILQGSTNEEFKAQAERMFLTNMTPDKIDAISRLIRDPMDRATVAQNLNKRRSRILDHFGIADTYREDEAKLLTRVPYQHQLDEFLTNLGELNAHLSEDEKLEWGKKVMAPDMTAGKLSGLIKELQDLKQEKDAEAVTAQQLIEEQKKAMEDALKDATPDASAFPTSGNNTSAIGADIVTPVAKSSNDLEHGDYLLDDEGNPIGRVLFKNVNSDGENYVGLVDDNGQFVEKTFDFDSDVVVDIGSRQRGGNFESEIPANDQRATPEGRQYINRLRSRANKVLNDIKQMYPDTKTLPNGDLVIASTTRTEASRLRRTFRFDVMVHRLPNEKFVSYVRRTQIDENGNQVGEVSIGRISKETHSSVHLNNRIKPLLGGGIYKGILASSPNNWFNNSPDLQREVIHPSTKQPIPVSLAPKNLNQKYIGNTGIETTNDPIKDALISHVADMIDRGHSAGTVLGRLNAQTVLSKQQVADIADRIQANRQFPGVNQVPYVSRDEMNLVREGDRVRHYHPDGTIREGFVIKRQPLIVSKKPQGDYGYTDTLRVRFDDGTRSPIVAKNLEIIRRADGSDPEVRPLVQQQNAAGNALPYVEPAGLPSNFEVRDTDTIRTFKHSKQPKLHAQGKIRRVVENNVDVYVPMVWSRGEDPNASLALTSRRLSDKNIAQEWLVAKMALMEEGYAREDAIRPPSSSAPQASRRNEEDIPDATVDPESGISAESTPRFITAMKDAKFDIKDIEDGEIEINMTNVDGKEDSELPVSRIIWKYGLDKQGNTVKKKQEIVTFPNNAAANANAGGITEKFNPNKSIEQNLEIARQRMRDMVQYELTGPHLVLGQELPYGDFAGIMAFKVGRKWFKMPQFEGDSVITPEREALYEEILSKMIPQNVQPSPSGVKKIFFMGGGPGAGKGGISKSKKVKPRDDDPSDFERPLLPVVQEWLEDGTAKPLTDGDPVGVMINPDDLKMQLPEAQAAFLRLSMQGELGTGAVRLVAKDSDWAAQVHEESSLLAKILTRRAMDRGLDIVVDGTGDDRLDKMIEKVKAAKAKGYRTIGTYINADPAVALGGAKSRQEETHRKVGEDIQIPTFIKLAKMLMPTGKKAVDGKPDSLRSGVFDEFVLYDRRDELDENGNPVPPYIVGHSEDGGDFIPNDPETANDLFSKLEQYIPNQNSKDPKDPMSYEAIFKRFREAGRRLANKKIRELKAEALQERSMSDKQRFEKYEKKRKLLKANILKNRRAVESIATELGIPISAVLADGRVASMLISGASVKDIVAYFRNRNGGSN